MYYPDGYLIAQNCQAHFPLRWYAGGTWSSKGGSHLGLFEAFLKGWFSCGGGVSCVEEKQRISCGEV